MEEYEYEIRSAVCVVCMHHNIHAKANRQRFTVRFRCQTVISPWLFHNLEILPTTTRSDHESSEIHSMGHTEKGKIGVKLTLGKAGASRSAESA